MEYHINIYNLLIGFGMLQGFIFGVLLCYKSKFKGSQFYLGLTVLFLSFYLLWVLKYDYGFQSFIPELQFLPVLFLWGIGPAFYAYLRFLFGQPISPKRLRWLFFPLLIEVLYFNTCSVITWINNWESSNMNALEKAMIYNIFSVEHIVGLIIIAVYLVKSYKLLQHVHVLYASNKIRSILICFALLWLIWVPYTIMDIAYYNFSFPPSKFYAFYILFAILTYGIGFFGFRISSETFVDVALPKSNAEDKSLEQVVSAEMKALSKLLNDTMKTERCYLDPDLNLASFSKIVNLHPNKTSAIINTVIGHSFRDFVNAYRIEEFKRQAKSYDLKSKTILSLAFDSGFNSKASFNRAFNKFCNTSPAEYLEEISKN